MALPRTMSMPSSSMGAGGWLRLGFLREIRGNGKWGFEKNRTLNQKAPIEVVYGGKIGRL